MKDLVDLFSIAVAFKVLLAGAVAGAIAYLGMYWQEKKRVESQIRSERLIAALGEIVYRLVEVNDQRYPEAPIGTRRFAELLFGFGVGKKTSDKDQGN